MKVGDAVAIVSPASQINPAFVDGACRVLESWGFRPVVGEFCKGSHGSFSGTLEQRLGDVRKAFANPDVRAVMCSRGGYGVVHLLEHLPDTMFADDPKWLIGFSDISAFHAASHHAGVASIHASMCKHLTERPDDECSRQLRGILIGNRPDYTLPGNQRNREGAARGKLIGGNMAVLSGLISTPYDLLREADILFIEDIGEAIYKIERMLYTLRLNGTLGRIKALIVGQFTDYNPSKDFSCMYDMVERMVGDYDFPVAYDFPVGHVDRNLPLIEGADVELAVSKEEVKLKFL